MLRRGRKNKILWELHENQSVSSSASSKALPTSSTNSCGGSSVCFRLFPFAKATISSYAAWQSEWIGGNTRVCFLCRPLGLILQSPLPSERRALRPVRKNSSFTTAPLCSIILSNTLSRAHVEAPGIGEGVPRRQPDREADPSLQIGESVAVESATKLRAISDDLVLVPCALVGVPNTT